MINSLATRRFWQNYLSTMGFLLLGWYICFELSPFHQGMLTNTLFLRPTATTEFAIHAPDLFRWLIATYALVLLPYYARYPWLRAKAWVLLRGLYLGWRRKTARPAAKQKKGAVALPTTLRPRVTEKTRQAGLAMLLKFFFAPLMINWCLGHIGDMLHNIGVVRNDFANDVPWRAMFDNALFWAGFQLILFVDTLLFTLGYIVEIPSLRNRIVTVEGTFLGWFVCLACYPPFNGHTSAFFPWQSNDFPHFADDSVHFFMNCAILILMGVYSWASVALGFKASNLTNRGIVSAGPYAFVRHPAYTAKNLAWWIGALPTFYIAFDGGLRGGLFAVLCTAGWSFIYTMRAITEERHLLRAGNGYAEYMAKVRWRFIPGVI